jgi:hypothetical protein
MATVTRIPTEAEYLERERRMLDKQLAAVESAPLAERREGAADYGRGLRDNPEIIAERIGWIFNGSYGRGAYDRAHEWLAAYRESPKRRETMIKFNLCCLLAALDDACPSRMAVNQWKKLTTEQQQRLDVLLTAEIADAMKGDDSE